MSILSKFTIKNLLLNKKRSIVTIIGIILSTALICATTGLVTSFQRTLINDEIKDQGSYHVFLKNVPKDDLKEILENRYVGSSYKFQTIGYAPLNETKNKYKPYVKLLGFDEKAFANAGIKLTKGRLPKNQNEIIVSEHLSTNAGVRWKLGDKVTLNLGERITSDGSNNSYDLLETTEDGKVTETFLPKEEKTYTIVGFIERPNYNIESYSDPGYTLITTLNERVDGSYMVGLLAKNPKDYDRLYKSITGYSSKNYLPDAKYDAAIHRTLLEYQGYSIGVNTYKTLILMGMIVIIIIMVSSVFAIKNSFSISVTERFKQYGMLRSVGATKKQIIKSVLFEGLCLGIIGIPLGILSGIFAVFVLIKLVGTILGPMLNGMEVIFYISWIPTLLAIFLGFITIILSAFIPAYKASKIAPIDAIRSSGDIKLNAKKIKAPKLINKIFGIGGVISYKSLKRSKKKYRTTVISLVVSVAIFIALSSFIDYGFKLSSVTYKTLGYNVSVFDDGSSVSEAYDKLNEISKLDKVNKYNLSLASDFEIDNSYLSSFGKEQFGEDEPNISIYSLSDEAFLRYVKEIGGNEADFKDKGILVDDYIYYQNDKKYEGNIYNVKPEDKIDLGNNKRIEIAKRTTERPMGYEASYSSSGYIFVSEQTLRDLSDDLYVYGLYIDSDNPDELCNEIDDLRNNNEEYSNVHYDNYEEFVRESDAFILIISIFLYGFITVITLIGVTNIFNTITTNMALRSKEFAMLKSVGMTKKEFNHMIRLESVFYGAKSFIIGTVIGLALSYLIHYAVTKSLETRYIFPYKSIIIAFIFVFLIVGLTMKYSLNKINKENIIETIRNDNI